MVFKRVIVFVCLFVGDGVDKFVKEVVWVIKLVYQSGEGIWDEQKKVVYIVCIVNFDKVEINFVVFFDSVGVGFF